MPTTTMTTSRRPPAARCQEIRGLLPAFAAERLGATATGEVQGHLLSCEACTEAFGDLLMEEMESGAVPLLTPPHVPPIEWYDAYMRAGTGRFGMFWKSVSKALEAADEGLRDWAQVARDEFAQTIDALATPLDPFAGAARSGAIRTRGAVRVRGAAVARPQPPATVGAKVVSPDGTPTGDVVPFAVDEAPRITPDGHFRVGLSTESDAHDDDLLICTLARSRGKRVSFVGAITRRPGQPLREVRIDEADVPGRGRAIPIDRVSLAVMTP